MPKTMLAMGLCLAALRMPAAAGFRYFDPGDPAAVPKTLSATGFFADMAAREAIPEAVPFEINAALWSDGAWKRRWILLPPGKTIPYVDTADFFAYPDSTVFAKDFLLEAREGDTASRVPWETRLLMKWNGPGGESRWHGFSYRWNAAGTEAYLVDPTADFDTLFRYAEAGGRRTYKRWRFPSTACNVCHKSESSVDPAGKRVDGRAVLGFYPAQLKRPAAGAVPGRDQIAVLFSRGVFSGAAPDSAALARRFVGIKEPIAPGLGPDERWAALDLRARSYLAANCSGCHGYRGIVIGAIGDKRVNFDFYRLASAIPFAHFPTQTFKLSDTSAYLPVQDPSGRAAYVAAVAMAGLDTAAGARWDMALPPFAGDPRESITPALLYPGYPSVTELLYRQVRRASPRLDSAKIGQILAVAAAGGDTAAAAKRLWMFGAPWGTPAWEDTLAAHGWTLDSVFALTGQFADGKYFWLRAPEQMPELASYLPDTAALDVLAEWVRRYPRGTAIRARSPFPPGAPRIFGRTLVVPDGRTGPIRMSDPRGRSAVLASIGPGLYRIPGSFRPGVYLVRCRGRAFRVVLP